MTKVATGINAVHEPPTSFQDELVGLLPQLRAFARSLCGNRDQADDLVQEAVARAWRARPSFSPGTNMRAWTFTILRNAYFSDLRRQKRQDSLAAEAVHDWTVPEQEGRLNIVDVERALMRLSPERRAALLLVSMGDFSYAEAAEICECPIGTLRSRVSRARRELEALLDDSLPAISG